MDTNKKSAFKTLVFFLSLLYLTLFVISTLSEVASGITVLSNWDIISYTAILGLTVTTTIGCFSYKRHKEFGKALLWKLLAILWILLILGNGWSLFIEDNYTTTEAAMIFLLVILIILPIAFALWDYGKVLAKKQNL